MFSRVFVIIWIFTSGPSQAQSWEFRYIDGSNAGELKACAAGITYNDGMFLTRIHDDQLDFFFGQTGLAVPPDRIVGRVIFEFKSERYQLIAYSGQKIDSLSTSSTLFLYPESSDSENILQSLRYSSQFELIFPNGDSFTIDLDGSSNALQKAFECWQSRETGSAGVNPFSSSEQDSSIGNPFH